MITLEELFGPWFQHPDATLERRGNADRLLKKVNRLLESAELFGIIPPVNQKTGSQISGDTLGGFRPQDAAQGSPGSSHKQGRGVDIYDPQNVLDDWLDDEILEEHGLYREHADSTPRWCHLTDRAPASGKRTFNP